MSENQAYEIGKYKVLGVIKSYWRNTSLCVRVYVKVVL